VVDMVIPMEEVEEATITLIPIKIPPCTRSIWKPTTKRERARGVKWT